MPLISCFMHRNANLACSVSAGHGATVDAVIWTSVPPSFFFSIEFARSRASFLCFPFRTRWLGTPVCVLRRARLVGGLGKLAVVTVAPAGLSPLHLYRSFHDGWLRLGDTLSVYNRSTGLAVDSAHGAASARPPACGTPHQSVRATSRPVSSNAAQQCAFCA